MSNLQILVTKDTFTKVDFQEKQIQLQWTPAFKSQRVGYQSNQKLLHHYQH